MTTQRPMHPGRILKERFLDPLGVTPHSLAKAIGVSTRRISELVKGNRRMTPDTAIRLGQFFGVPAAWWLEMQARYDTEGVPLLDEISERVARYEGLAHVLVTPNGVRLLDSPEESPQGALLMRVPDDLLERLRAQAALGPRRAPREIRTVTFANGATALIGDDG